MVAAFEAPASRSAHAISAHIKTLESGLGISLFERVGRRSVVNSAGQVLYEKAERVFEAVDDLKAAMENLRGSHTGRLRLGASVVWQYCLPGVLHQFKRKFPLWTCPLRSPIRTLSRDWSWTAPSTSDSSTRGQTQ